MIDPEFTRGYLAGLTAATQVTHEAQEKLLECFDSEQEKRAALIASALFEAAFEQAAELIKGRNNEKKHGTN